MWKVRKCSCPYQLDRYFIVFNGIQETARGWYLSEIDAQKLADRLNREDYDNCWS